MHRPDAVCVSLSMPLLRLYPIPRECTHAPRLRLIKVVYMQICKREIKRRLATQRAPISLSCEQLVLWNRLCYVSNAKCTTIYIKCSQNLQLARKCRVMRFRESGCQIITPLAKFIAMSMHLAVERSFLEFVTSNKPWSKPCVLQFLMDAVPEYEFQSHVFK